MKPCPIRTNLSWPDLLGLMHCTAHTSNMVLPKAGMGSQVLTLLCA